MAKLKKKNNKTKNATIYDRSSIIDYINNIYILFIFGLFPIIMDHKYFNITITRYNWFMIGTIFFIVFSIFAFIIESVLTSSSGEKFINFDINDKSIFLNVDFYFILFIIANFIAWIMADDKKAALSGSSGRYFGLAIIIVIGIMYLLLSRTFKFKTWHIFLIGIISLFSMTIGFVQYCGIDIFELKLGISEIDMERFMSTFGNINIYSSYLSMMIPLFMGLFIFSSKLKIKIISVIIIFSGAISMVVSQSDGCYLALVITCYIMFFVSLYSDKILNFILSIIFLFAGYFTIAILNFFYGDSEDKVEGIVKAFSNVKLIGTVFISLIMIFLVLYIIIKGGIKSKISIKKSYFIIGIIVFTLISLIIMFTVGINSGNSWFEFNYKWGTKRGYVWSRSIEVFFDAPIINKLFGYGNESLKQILSQKYSHEMIDLTNKTYDNAHNEVIQYLVTTGLLGALAYIGIFVSTIIYTIKSKVRTEYIYALLLAVIGYFTQAMVNLNQPITTPFYFVLIAMLIGNIRYNKYGVEKMGGK